MCGTAQTVAGHESFHHSDEMFFGCTVAAGPNRALIIHLLLSGNTYHIYSLKAAIDVRLACHCSSEIRGHANMFRGHFPMSNCIITKCAHRPDSGYNYIESLRAHRDKIALIMSSAYLKLNIFHITMTSGKNIFFYMKYPIECD